MIYEFSTINTDYLFAYMNDNKLLGKFVILLCVNMDGRNSRTPSHEYYFHYGKIDFSGNTVNNISPKFEHPILINLLNVDEGMDSLYLVFGKRIFSKRNIGDLNKYGTIDIIKNYDLLINSDNIIEYITAMGYLSEL